MADIGPVWQRIAEGHGLRYPDIAVWPYGYFVCNIGWVGPREARQREVRSVGTGCFGQAVRCWPLSPPISSRLRASGVPFWRAIRRDRGRGV